MIRKNRGEIHWLEFELLQGQGVLHGVFLRQGVEFFGLQEVLFLNQVHGKEVVVVNHAKEVFSADGAITKTKELGLVIKHADCQAAIFFDPVEKVIACVHAGWRGLVHNIYRETIEKLKKEFRCDPENLLVCIGPSLEPEHSEFIHYKEEFPESFWRFQVKPNYFHLWEIATFQLKEEGVCSHHIEIANLGTYSNPDDFYSYRRSKTLERHKTICALL